MDGRQGQANLSLCFGMNGVKPLVDYNRQNVLFLLRFLGSIVVDAFHVIYGQAVAVL
jgi:hypothetical protein